jgi:hypothetical protein
MNNEPKWTFDWHGGKLTDGENIVNLSNQKEICDTLNRLEAENAELRERLKRLEEDLDAATSPEVLANVSTTPRTDAVLTCQNSCFEDSHCLLGDHPTCKYKQPAREGEQNG